MRGLIRRLRERRPRAERAAAAHPHYQFDELARKLGLTPEQLQGARPNGLIFNIAGCVGPVRAARQPRAWGSVDPAASGRGSATGGPSWSVWA